MTGTDARRRAPEPGRGRHVPSPVAGILAGATLLIGGAAVYLAWNLPTSGRGPVNLDEADRVLVSALASDDTGTYAEADALYANALDAHPDDVAALRGAAVVDLGLHRFASALDRAEAALTIQPNDHVALAALVDANIELGHYDEAETQLDRLLALRPGVQAYSRLSYLRQLRGDDAGALEAMFLARASAAEGSAEQARVDDLLGELYYELGELEAALRYRRKAVAAAPGRYEVGLARTLAAAGELDAARAVLDEKLAADPENGHALMLLVELASAQPSAVTDDPDADDPDAGGPEGEPTPAPAGPSASRIDEAVETVVEAAAGELAAGYGTDPSQALFEATYADPDEALQLARVIYGRRPDNIKADHALAWALHRAGRSEEAVAPLEAALRFDTSDAVLHRHAAEIYEAVGRDDDARRHRERADGLRPPLGGD